MFLTIDFVFEKLLGSNLEWGLALLDKATLLAVINICKLSFTREKW